MQDQRGNLDESHVPGQRHPSDDGDWTGDSTRAGDGHADDTAVGTAHIDHETGVIHDSDLHDGDRRDGDVQEGGTYASGSALADADHDGVADRDDVEVVDHDQALAEEQAEERAEDRADERAEEHEAREETEVRGDADFVPADVDPRADDRDEVEAAAAEDAEDRAWAAGHADAANADDTLVDEAYAADAARTDDDAARTDDDADADVADDTDADTDAERRDDDPFAEPVATSEALEGGEALDAGDVVAVPVPDAHDRTDGAAGQDLLPGAVPTVPVGAIWAEGAVDGLRERWRELQLRFIDDPRSVAGEADQLVAEAVSTITGALESQRERLSAWQGEGGEDTERLRAAVRQYRDFLDRLLGL